MPVIQAIRAGPNQLVETTLQSLFSQCCRRSMATPLPVRIFVFYANLQVLSEICTGNDVQLHYSSFTGVGDKQVFVGEVCNRTKTWKRKAGNVGRAGQGFLLDFRFSSC
jgi:hypothetical protein